MGSTVYQENELISILNQSDNGNGLIKLARALIAAKLNIENGAESVPAKTAVNFAEKKIGTLVIPPKGTGFLTMQSINEAYQKLKLFNDGMGLLTRTINQSSMQ